MPRDEVPAAFPLVVAIPDEWLQMTAEEKDDFVTAFLVELGERAGLIGRSGDSSIAIVRSDALAAARAATARGFLAEPNVDWLMRRAWIAALRSIARSDHPQADRVAHEWAPGAFELPDVDWPGLPCDGPAERILLDPDLFSIVDLFDSTLPLPDEPEGIVAMRRLGVRTTVVLDAVADRHDPFLVTRVSMGGHDRWFRYWGGSAQDGNYDMEPPVPSTRAARLAEARYWAEVTATCVGQVHELTIRADARTTRAVEQIILSHWPHVLIHRAT